jgi:DNA polymerase III subunit gamma/tau
MTENIMILSEQLRPRTFDEMIGQSVIKSTLQSSLTNQSVHQVYLFSGHHGIGKTSIARIFAAAMNCQKSPAKNPCLTCNHCQLIKKEKLLDFIELDAASRTKVDDIKSILEQVHYPPVQAPFKVYLIDEIHMLSTHSFNALLKTLESPPKHVRFLLATTEPQKLPDTIKSRCLHFHLQALSNDEIKNYLSKILQEKTIQSDRAAIEKIATSANGSVRDAINLLQKVLSHEPKKCQEETVNHLLALADKDLIDSLLSCLKTHDYQQLSTLIDIAKKQHLNAHGIYKQLLDAVYKYIRNNSASGPWVKLYQSLIQSKDLIPYSPSPYMGLEVLLRQIFMDQTDASNAFTETRIQSSSLVNKPAKKMINNSPNQQSQTNKTDSTTIAESNWLDIVNSLQLSGMTKAVLMQCQFVNYQDNTIFLSLTKKQQVIWQPQYETRILQGLKKCGHQVKIHMSFQEKIDQTLYEKDKIKQLKTKQELDQKTAKHDLIQTLSSEFHATLKPDDGNKTSHA